MERYRYVVVGNSAGGIAAARAIRSVDDSGSLLMVSEEPYPAYSRPLIAKQISEGKDVAHMALVPPEYYSEHDIDLWLGARVSSLDVAGHTVTTTDGRQIEYERLLLATGSSPIVPPIEGSNRQSVHTFTTFDDAQAIARKLSAVTKVVVVGGGFIGLSAADALRKRGVGVTVVEMQPHVLSGMLDSAASMLVEDAARTAGVSVLTNRRVASINGESLTGRAVSSATLDDGTRLPCELVIMAVGVRPRTDLANGQFAVERGFVVDETMKTTAEDVYSCGDACQVYDYVRGAAGIVAVWPNAVAGGAVAGSNMAGESRSYTGATTLNALPYFGLAVGSAGILDGPAEEGFETLVSQAGGVYRKVVLRDGIVVGMVFAGDTTRCGLIYNLMKNKVPAGNFKEALVSDSLGLLSLPPELWRRSVSDREECDPEPWRVK